MTLEDGNESERLWRHFSGPLADPLLCPPSNHRTRQLRFPLTNQGTNERMHLRGHPCMIFATKAVRTGTEVAQTFASENNTSQDLVTTILAKSKNKKWWPISDGFITGEPWILPSMYISCSHFSIFHSKLCCPIEKSLHSIIRMVADFGKKLDTLKI